MDGRGGILVVELARNCFYSLFKNESILELGGEKESKVRGSLCSMCDIYKVCKVLGNLSHTFLSRSKYLLGM